MDNEKKLNLFISHYNKDMEYLPKLKELLEKRGYVVRDSSIDETEPNNAKNPDYIKTLLRPKIKWAGTMLVLIGPETYKSDWVNWEIEYAASFGDKRIVGVYLRGATDSDIPKSLNQYGDALVPWNSRKLNDAIGGENIWHDIDDNPRPVMFDINRSNC